MNSLSNNNFVNNSAELRVEEPVAKGSYKPMLFATKESTKAYDVWVSEFRRMCNSPLVDALNIAVSPNQA